MTAKEVFNYLQNLKNEGADLEQLEFVINDTDHECIRSVEDIDHNSIHVEVKID